MNTNIDKLRRHYLKMESYHYDVTFTDDKFTPDEISNIKKYGWWFNAIWSDKVTLLTDRLKHFYDAKNDNLKERTQWKTCGIDIKNGMSFLKLHPI